MQLMHMLNCLYASSSAGVWRYSTSGSTTMLPSSRMIHGLTRGSFAMKSDRSTTRSRTTGKFARGSTVTGPGAEAERNVAQVSLGSPSTFMPQLPQMPIRHDQRNDSVVSISFLTWLSPSRTVHSFRIGTSYSCQLGSESVSGRYRDTLSRMLSAMATCRRSVHPEPTG